MSHAKCHHYGLTLVEPEFSSPITDLVLELDFLRKKELQGTTHPLIFFQLKHIFHFLESLGSARIEGNNTTLAEYVETKVQEGKNVPEKIQEIQNIESAMDFVDQVIKDHPINRALISELHKRVVHSLSFSQGEGDRTPGAYRKSNVQINHSSHTPPEAFKVEEYMQELYDFISNRDSPKYDLLKTALVHHRFVWIHPFNNGNGRTVRLLTYAMLVKQGFNVHIGRILNPTAVFCANRTSYYDHLASADTGRKEGLLKWCEYVLRGIKTEIEKIDKLLDYSYLSKEILLPSLDDSLQRGYVTAIEAKILLKAIHKQVIQAEDIKEVFPEKAAPEISRQIRKLIDKKILLPESEGKRKYLIRFDQSYLLRSVMSTLSARGFVALRDQV